MQIHFYKYQGTGNDFIILDNRAKDIHLTTQQIAFLCDRRFGVGADGLMLYQSSKDRDFEMVYYNADGKEGSMCGNGGRCLVQFAYDNGVRQLTYQFEATDGLHEAEFGRNGWVHLQMKNVDAVQKYGENFVLDTGSPHFVMFVDKLMKMDIITKAKAIRYNNSFKDTGINVNFVEPVEDGKIIVRTYERGVEDETFSCGTGVTASALLSAHHETGFNRVAVETKGGELAVEFEKINDKQFKNIWLCGTAQFVFKGEIELPV